MDWPKVCPTCLSKYADIRGMVYPAGGATGDRCEHEWHKGEGYDPSVLNLTDDDRAFLMREHIKWF